MRGPDVRSLQDAQLVEADVAVAADEVVLACADVPQAVQMAGQRRAAGVAVGFDGARR